MTSTTEFTDPIRAAEAIVDRVGRDIALAIPVGIGKPNLLVNAIYDLAAADPKLKLRILTGLSLVRPVYKSDIERRFVAPLLDREFGSYPDLAYAEAMRRGPLPSNVEVHEFFLQAGQWLSSMTMQASYASLSYSHVAAHLVREEINVMAQLMAPSPDPAVPNLSLASNPDVSLDLKGYVESRRSSGSPIVVAAETNANLPYMRGEAEIERSAVDILLTPPAPHFELFAPPKEPVSLADYAMALHASTLIRDGGTLQIGIGSFADALTHALILRHTRNTEFRELIASLASPLPQGAQLEPFNLGLYGCSELLVDGFLALRRAGILKRKVEAAGRNILVHAGFFLGNRAFYRELAALPLDARDEIGMTAISFTNTLRGDAPGKIAHRRDARFVNSALVATLLGAASSDALDDGRVVSGIGGQNDFVSQAFEIPGARSIIAVRATRGGGSTATSNIVWRYANVSIPRQLRDIYVTEYGVADVRGRSDREVAEAMLAIADSRFHQALIRDASRIGKLPSGYRPPHHAANNTPEAIARVLGPARRSGLLPVFPLGTEMTETEQTLIPALGRLRNAGKLDILAMLWQGWRAPPSDRSEFSVIERMALVKPGSWKESAMRALILGALRTNT